MNNTGNNKISLFQYSLLIYILSQPLFETGGYSVLFNNLEHDTIIAIIVAMVIAIPMILMLLYQINYEPDLNLFAKNTKLFGKIIGTILNISIMIISFVIYSSVISNLDGFSSIKYLSKTPYMYVGAAFSLIAAYSNIKGIETIVRKAELMLIILLLIDMIMIPSTVSMFQPDNYKPLLVHQPMSIFQGSLLFLAYFLTPVAGLVIIPKNNIKNNEKLNKYVLITVLISLAKIFMITSLIMSSIDVAYLKTIRFANFNLMRMIKIGNFFQNMEQFLSYYWVISMFTYATFGLYFISQNMKETFKIKKKNTENLIIILVAIATPILASFLFKNTTEDLKYIKDIFPTMISLPILINTAIACIFIFIKKRKNKTT
jgi:spore germination protein (amino acid permease)